MELPFCPSSLGPNRLHCSVHSRCSYFALSQKNPSVSRRAPSYRPAFLSYRNGRICLKYTRECSGFLVRAQGDSSTDSETVSTTEEGVEAEGNVVGNGANRNGQGDVQCIGTGTEVECIIEPADSDSVPKDAAVTTTEVEEGMVGQVANLLLLVSPFFFWGTSMAVMKVAAPHTSPLFVGAVRLLPAGILLLIWAALVGRPQPKSTMAWVAVTLFAIVDGACFQGFLAEGLQRTSAGLGSVIIDSQPLTVAVLAALLYDESLTAASILGLGLGVAGLGLLEVPPEILSMGPQSLLDMLTAASDAPDMGSIWDRGEWWMLLAAQSMAVGTVMVRWVSKYCDPVVATGWHMVIGSVPLLVLCTLQESDILLPRLAEFNAVDAACLVYITLLGSAASYGVFFYNASRGNLTALSSLTFLTPVFATAAGYLTLGETLTPLQLGGALVTLGSIFCINCSKQDDGKG